MKTGQLFYLMGASGAGKDSLIEYTEQHLNCPEKFCFVRRHITRATKSSHHSRDYHISEIEFRRLQNIDYFAMHWERHGIFYGITNQIQNWMKQGNNVIINGSRKHFSTVLQTYPNLHAIWVTADLPTLNRRLHKRDREPKQKIRERMQDALSFQPKKIVSSYKLSYIDNNGPLKAAGEKFLQLLQP